jgi:hypothetical protein
MRECTAFLGHKFDMRDPKIILTPSLQFIRRINVDIAIHTSQYTGNHLARILADSLSSSLYSLRHLGTSGVEFHRSQIHKVIDACLQDPDHGFERILQFNLGPLRVLRGVTLHFACLTVPWTCVPWLHRVMCTSIHSRHAIKQLFRRMDQELNTTLRILAAEVSQDADTSHREESPNPPDIGNPDLSQFFPPL